MEEWRDVIDYEGLYQVSSYGVIKSVGRIKTSGKKIGGSFYKEKIMKCVINEFGYKRVNLSKNGKARLWFVNRLVAIAFHKNPLNLPIVNHINSNRLDNRSENLEWATQAYNLSHAIKFGHRKTPPSRKGKNNDKNTSTALIQKTKEGQIIKIWPSFSEILRIRNIHADSIRKCLRKEKMTAGGYKWEYSVKNNT